MNRAYKMRAYPTAGQVAKANRMLRVHCDIYNACLNERIAAYKMSRVSVPYGMQSAQLKAVREVYPAAAEFSFSAEQRTVRRVDRAFQAFFDRIKRGDTPGFPRYKPWQRFNTVDHTAGDGAKWVPTEGRWARAYFQGVGHVKVSEHTHIQGKVKTLSLVRDGRKWFVVVVADQEIEPLAPTGQSVGVDVGIARFLTTSDGEVVRNRRFLAAALDELADLQQRYAATGRRSKNLKRAIGKLHRKIRNQRLDFHHQTARRLVDQYDLIAVEDLNVKGMSKRAAPKPDPVTPASYLPNGGAAKSGLNRNINDVGWAQFTTILYAKAERAGREVVKVNPAHTSIRCHACQATCRRPEQATVVCPTHGPIDADINGAINILGRGMASRAAA
jgi:putative transposase